MEHKVNDLRSALEFLRSMPGRLKHVFIVDEDVDCFDINDVLWAMNTRFQGDADIITIPGVRCHPLDPSNDPSCSPGITEEQIREVQQAVEEMIL